MRGGVIEKTVHSQPRSLKSEFLEATGYSEYDVLSWNLMTRKFLTRNGGIYILTERGTIKHLAGPSPDPSDRV